MNLFELIAFLAVLFGLAWGVYHAADGSLWATLHGGVLGAGKGFLVFVIFLLLICTVLAVGLRYRPSFPRCKKGNCKDTDFRYVYSNIVPDESADERDKQLHQQHRGMLVRCGCGDLYLRSNRDRKFYEVRDDRTLAPFMTYRPGGRWHKDGAVLK